ncbi:substrate-binding domain-containing protein [Aestuariispira insulae]|uniref:Ca-activated chloride channel family protein n=1 Tax=Aestuariispira insulae TaxID=1461337 RepID=A0A3D9H8J6_9PROT|nr:substrate-binding domain-containing protein [Aestuariispira insulae]RED45808.1 Ca-activated chloride channel family protein [Aestuariispira insulae]
MLRKRILTGMAAGLLGLLLSGCNDGGTSRTVTLISGSENKSLFPIVQDFADQQGIDLEIKGRGSVDIMLDIRKGTRAEADIVWPAASLWLELGDLARVVKHEKSIMRSPVVFWVKKNKAETLGWTGRDVTMADIVSAAEGGLTFGMTSATQSNSGAMAYFAMLSAAAGRPNVLTEAHVNDPAVKSRVAELLKGVDRTSGSSGWLGDLYLEHPGAMDAMFNYEAVGIEVNQALERAGGEPLCAIYPADGLAIADSPLAYVDKGDSDDDQAIEAFFLKLQEHLLSDKVQAKLAASGRRVGPLGLSSSTLSDTVFRKDWCIDTGRAITALTIPEQSVIEAALRVYQGETRRPSEIVFLLDYSGSMTGDGNHQLVEALSNLLLEVKSKTFFLETTADDIFYAVPFNDSPLAIWKATGNSATSLEQMFRQIEEYKPNGGTDIYAASARGLTILNESGHGDTHSQMILLLTDGQSQGAPSMVLERLSPDPAANKPIFSILFGQASETQVEQLAKASAARVFDGRKGLVDAFRNARGYAN